MSNKTLQPTALPSLHRFGKPAAELGWVSHETSMSAPIDLKHLALSFLRFGKRHVALMMASTYLRKIQLTVMDEPTQFSEEHDALARILGPTFADPHDYLMAALFVGHIAEFETFLRGLVESVVLVYPMKLGSSQVRISDVLEAGSTETVILRAVDELINKLLYKKPLEYRDAIAELLSIDPRDIEQPWKNLIEAKARRDLGVHADWRCNEVYLRKLQEGGVASPLKLGESAVPKSGDYLQGVLDGLYSLADQLMDHVLYKVFKQTRPLPSDV